METESIKSEQSSRSRRSRGHNTGSSGTGGTGGTGGTANSGHHHRSSRHSHRSNHSSKNKRPDMAPFQTTVNLGDDGRGTDGEIIEVQILPQDDNWGENTTAITGIKFILNNFLYITFLCHNWSICLSQ